MNKYFNNIKKFFYNIYINKSKEKCKNKKVLTFKKIFVIIIKDIEN